MKNNVVLFVAIACFVAGFFLGRGKKIVKEEIRYERQETQMGHYGVQDLMPERSELPDKIDLPTVPVVVWTEGRADTVFREADTAAIVRDYSATYHYSKLLFDNADGKLTLNAGTQYNRLAYLDYEFTPVREVRTKTTGRRWMPFVSAGYSTNNCLSVGGGVFYHNIGIEYLYNRNVKVNDSFHSFFLKYKF